MKFVIFLLALLLFHNSNAIGCQCDISGPNTFEATTKSYISAFEKNPDVRFEMTIIEGKVIGHTHDRYNREFLSKTEWAVGRAPWAIIPVPNMEEYDPHPTEVVVEVLKVLYGNFEEDTVKIEGAQFPNSCWPVVRNFSIDTVWKFAFLNPYPGYYENYHFGRCGTYAQRIDPDKGHEDFGPPF